MAGSTRARTGSSQTRLAVGTPRACLLGVQNPGRAGSSVAVLLTVVTGESGSAGTGTETSSCAGQTVLAGCRVVSASTARRTNDATARVTSSERSSRGSASRAGKGGIASRVRGA